MQPETGKSCDLIWQGGALEATGASSSLRAKKTNAPAQAVRVEKSFLTQPCSIWVFS
jgi:hypothetical protein